jgi:hypothetical protein
MIRLFTFLLFSALSVSASAATIPDFSANYLVKVNGLQAGELVRSLTTLPDGTREFKAESQAKGMFAFFKPDVISETSIWQDNNGKVQPLSYLYTRTGGKKEKYLQMTFNWKRLKAFIDDKERPWRLKIEPNVLDKLVYQISLMQELTPETESIDYRIADGGKLKDYHIKVLGTETIETPLGKIETIKLTRERTQDEKRQTTLWCAPALNYMPVKLEHSEKGSSFTALIRRLKGYDVTNAFTPLHAATTDEL